MQIPSEFYVFDYCFKILKNELNVTNFGYVFVTRFHMTFTNFPGD